MTNNRTDIGSSQLTDEEKDALGEIFNISMGSAATSLSTLLGKQVDITTPNVRLVYAQNFEYSHLEPSIGIEISYIKGLSGSNLLIMRKNDILKIVALLLGEEAVEQANGVELDEMHVSAVSEIMNQMMGASSTALANFLGKTINISTPTQFEPSEMSAKLAALSGNERIVAISFEFKVQDMINSEFITVFPLPFTKTIINLALYAGSAEEPAPQTASLSEGLAENAPPHTVEANDLRTATAPEPEASEPVASEPGAPDPVASEPETPEPGTGKRAGGEARTGKAGSAGSRAPSGREEPAPARPESSAASHDEKQVNLNLLMDVMLDTAVEIGRTRKTIKEVLDLRAGSVIAFSKEVDEPVDVIVNGRLFARGEVVVVEDHFGVRITELVSEKDRL